MTTLQTDFHFKIFLSTDQVLQLVAFVWISKQNDLTICHMYYITCTIRYAKHVLYNVEYLFFHITSNISYIHIFIQNKMTKTVVKMENYNMLYQCQAVKHVTYIY